MTRATIRWLVVRACVVGLLIVVIGLELILQSREVLRGLLVLIVGIIEIVTFLLIYRNSE